MLCCLIAFIIFMAECLENGTDYNKPSISKKTVPGTCVKLGFTLCYIILNLTCQCRLHTIQQTLLI